MALSPAQKSRFFEDGYLVVENLIAPAALDELRRGYANLVLGRVPEFPERHVSRRSSTEVQDVEIPVPHGTHHHRNGTQVFPRGGELYRAQRRAPIEDPLDAINKVNMPSRYDDTFAATVRHPAIVDIIADLMGPNIKAYYDQVFAKPPYADANRYHQDSVFWAFFASNFQITCQLLLDDSTTENGCIRFIPGSHNYGLINWEHLPHMLTEEILAREVAVPLKAGDATFHHSLTLHCSGPNTTPRRRRGWSIHYVAAETPYIGTPAETERVKQLDCLDGLEPVNGWPLIRGRQFPGCV